MHTLVQRVHAARLHQLEVRHETEYRLVGRPALTSCRVPSEEYHAALLGRSSKSCIQLLVCVSKDVRGECGMTVFSPGSTDTEQQRVCIAYTQPTRSSRYHDVTRRS
ncbi:hypothetical protein [Streptomyces sp. NPDC001678]|uniref:hypothetical protein n=1 Tax=Streptomyces sp. NPDC001678 TaxID=3364599 RepID=UPI0036B85981